MKPHLLKIHLQPDQSFSVRHDIVPHFYNKLHHHPELELVHIIKGSGRQFIGNNIHHFKSGDMILLGANLPHYWRSEDSYFAPDSQQKCEAIVVHFIPIFLGDTFLNLPENKAIVKLFQKALQAVRIKNDTQRHVSDWLEKLLVAKNSERIVLLLQILEAIANSKDTKTICSKGLEFHYNPRDVDRLNAIYQFVLQNFSSEITLNQVARVAHISPQAFCRYFKSRIKKTFSKFLIEVRIGHACKLLAETNKSVADICYECGYNNFSNFNRHFKNLTKKTPLEHRHHYTFMGK
jgi:AraC-like DNA-binding protein